MGAIFIDTSALVKFYYPEEGSEDVEAVLLQADRVYICQITVAEFASALMKKVRTGTLDMEAQVVIWNTFAEDCNSGQMEILSLENRDYLKAAEITRGFGGKEGIRTLDSLQLVAALDVAKAHFLCADKTLSHLAAKVGLKVESI